MTGEIVRLASGPLALDMETLRLGKGPPLLFLHGIDGVEGARPLIELLAQSFAVHAPSHPGFGASNRPASVTTTEDLSFLYLDYIEQLGIKDATLVGASFGAWLACEILTRDASRFSYAILAGPLGMLQTEDRRNVLADIFSIPANAWSAAFCKNPVNLVAPKPGMDAAQLLRIARNREAAALYGWSPYMANPKLAQRLHRIRIPTLLLQGEADVIAPIAYGKAFAAAIPQARYQMVSDCGHLVHADAPKALAEIICNFAGRQDAERLTA